MIIDERAEALLEEEGLERETGVTWEFYQEACFSSACEHETAKSKFVILSISLPLSFFLPSLFSSFFYYFISFSLIDR